MIKKGRKWAKETRGSDNESKRELEQGKGDRESRRRRAVAFTKQRDSKVRKWSCLFKFFLFYFHSSRLHIGKTLKLMYLRTTCVVLAFLFPCFPPISSTSSLPCPRIYIYIYILTQLVSASLFPSFFLFLSSLSLSLFSLSLSLPLSLSLFLLLFPLYLFNIVKKKKKEIIQTTSPPRPNPVHLPTSDVG